MICLLVKPDSFSIYCRSIHFSTNAFSIFGLQLLMWNPFKTATKPVKPRSRLETVTSTMLLLGCVVVIGSWLAPGLLGNLVKASGKTFALLLLFLLLARVVSARIGAIFGGWRN